MIYLILIIFASTYGNTMGTFSWKHRFSDNLNTNLSLFYSDYKFNLQIPFQKLEWDSKITNYGLKYNWNHTISDNFKLNYGIDGLYYDFNPELFSRMVLIRSIIINN